MHTWSLKSDAHTPSPLFCCLFAVLPSVFCSCMPWVCQQVTSPTLCLMRQDKQVSSTTYTCILHLPYPHTGPGITVCNAVHSVKHAPEHLPRSVVHPHLTCRGFCACTFSCPAEEPLSLCALAGLAGPATSVVLAGDPKQLGPVIHSGVAREAGLGLSLLERLTSMPPYAAVVEGGSSSSSSSSADGLIVKLVRNYRSHPKLLELPSQLFYQGELKACASPDITDTLLHWDKLPNKRSVHLVLVTLQAWLGCCRSAGFLQRMGYAGTCCGFGVVCGRA